MSRGRAVPRDSWNFTDRKDLGGRSAGGAKLRTDDVRATARQAQLYESGAIMNRDLRPRAVGAAAMTRVPGGGGRITGLEAGQGSSQTGRRNVATPRSGIAASRSAAPIGERAATSPAARNARGSAIVRTRPAETVPGNSGELRSEQGSSTLRRGAMDRTETATSSGARARVSPRSNNEVGSRAGTAGAQGTVRSQGLARTGQNEIGRSEAGNNTGRSDTGNVRRPIQRQSSPSPGVSGIVRSSPRSSSGSRTTTSRPPIVRRDDQSSSASQQNQRPRTLGGATSRGRVNSSGQVDRSRSSGGQDYFNRLSGSRSLRTRPQPTVRGGSTARPPSSSRPGVTARPSSPARPSGSRMARPSSPPRQSSPPRSTGSGSRSRSVRKRKP